MNGPVSNESSLSCRQMLLIGVIIITLLQETLVLKQEGTSSHHRGEVSTFVIPKRGEWVDRLKQTGGAAICAIQKWGLPYIDEWVDYHLALGFEKIYIYDNSDEFELEEWHKQHENRQALSVKHYPGENRQISSYNDCVHSVKNKSSHSWVAFLDIDEFFVFRNTAKYPCIMDFLSTLPVDLGGLAVSWQVFNFNNQTKYKPQPLTLRFQEREPETNIHVKIIARVDFFSHMGIEPHCIHTVNTKLHKITDSSGNVVDGPFNFNKTDDEIVLFHYQTKSVEEYRTRCTRGRADTTFNESAHSAQLYCSNATDKEVMAAYGGSTETIIDDSAWKFLKKRVPKYTKFEIDPSFEIEILK